MNERHFRPPADFSRWDCFIEHWAIVKMKPVICCVVNSPINQYNSLTCALL